MKDSNIKRITSIPSKISVTTVNSKVLSASSSSNLESGDGANSGFLNSKEPTKELMKSPTKRNTIKVAEFTKKNKFLCTFCGGKKCRHENWLNNPKSPIKGLHCDWINDKFLAMQRLSNRIIKEYDIIKQFKDVGISAVFNMQEPGEHPYCGDGIDMATGFSYSPEALFENGIFFYNFGWKDMTNTDYTNIFKILSMIDMTVSQGGKVSVHCHAGKGRTAVVICSWLIFKDRISAFDAIKLFRSKRDESLTKEKQRTWLQKFENFLVETRKSFKSNVTSLTELIKSQQILMFGEEKDKSKFMPVILYKIVDRVLLLLNNNTWNADSVWFSFYQLEKQNVFSSLWSNSLEIEIENLKKNIDEMKFNFTDFKDPRVLIQTLLDFLDHFPQPIIKPASVKKIQEVRDLLKGRKLNTVFAHPDLNDVLDKFEFYIIQYFVKLIIAILDKSDSLKENLKDIVFRIAVSLTSQRKALDHSFFNRSVINFKNKDISMPILIELIVDWISEAYEDGLEEIEASFKGLSSPILVKNKSSRPTKSSLFQLKPVQASENSEEN